MSMIPTISELPVPELLKSVLYPCMLKRSMRTPPLGYRRFAFDGQCSVIDHENGKEDTNRFTIERHSNIPIFR
jgi:hypothetical protein